MFVRHKMCIALRNTPGVDRDICSIGVLYISHLEGTKCYALLSVTHQLLTGMFVLLELPFFMFRNHKKLCFTSCSCAVVDRDICATGVSLFYVQKTRNAVCYLEKHISCLQGYLCHWSDLISCLEGTKCSVFHHTTPQLLTEILVPLEDPYFRSGKHKILCLTLSINTNF